MKLYGIGIDVVLYRTVEIPGDCIEEEDIYEYISLNYTNKSLMIDAIMDGDYQIGDLIYNQVGNHDTEIF
jgi:hypothetical protein